MGSTLTRWMLLGGLYLRPDPEYVAGIQTDVLLCNWLERGLTNVRALPPKGPKAGA